jgi:PAS domain S-box-containing protein
MTITSDALLKAIIDNNKIGVWAAERIGSKIQPVLYTPAIKIITGFSADSFLNNPKLWFNIIHPDDSEEVIRKIRKFYNDEQRINERLEYRIVNNTGTIVWLENKISVIRNEWGEVQRVFGLVSDISHLKSYEEQLKQSAEKLQKLNEMKDRFISIISHDLRTPFNSILGFVDMMLEESSISSEDQKTYLNFIKDSSTSMYNLVNSLLDWTRLQTGRINFTPETINANAYVKKSKEMMTGMALQKNIEIINDLPQDIYIYADENLLLQVFNNIISNSIKFSKPGGTITISSKNLTEERMIRFSIKDSGVGIKNENIYKLFEVDKKLSTVGTQGEKGSGLGLSLCYEIVSKHGGKIWAESYLDIGTTIHFTIPIASEQILLVDDVNTDRILYSKLIKSIVPDHEVIEAQNGADALEIIKHISPALIISDHKMPLMDGLEMIKNLNCSDFKFKPPVIILSSHLDDETKNEYKKLGIEYVFGKPVNLSIFKKAIDRSIEQSVRG